MPPTLEQIVAAETKRLSRDADVQVSLRDGVATLTGHVANEARRRLIEQGLLQLPEVDDVRNFLTISPPLGDLRAQLESVLEREGVAIQGLRVAVSEGVVTLEGRAEGWFDRDAAERLTWELPDVRAVANRIVLNEGAVEPDTDEELPV